ncbi:hypothetical protein D9758_003564 [Tetrapyrgos nigripes]|uniref:Uncharacterized protein n=1 Tax=Tetrapyrgos nigripes TaxID=182062 RepID=A0A8H5GVU1_9AGAR|nr:hypothetical protein D9758_003564 [Tetrapyrgos nigripes]
MAPPLPLVSVNLATVPIETFCYAIFFILNMASVAIQVISHTRRETVRSGFYAKLWGLLKNPMFLGTVALFITVTGHWICTIIRLFDAFVNFKGGTQALEYYADLSQISEVVKTGFLMASLCIGDSMIIYRVWVVWGHKTSVIIFPLLTLAGLTVCGIGITYQFTQYFPGLDVFNSDAGRWITSDCAFTLSTNLYSTAMIAFKIWTTDRNLQRSGTVKSGMGLKDTLNILVESAAIYTSWTIFFFASYQSGSNLQFNAVDVWPEMAGISATLINVRAGLGSTFQISSSQNASASYAQASYRMNRNLGSQQDRAQYPMQPLSVNISTVVDRNPGGDNDSLELGVKGGSS